MGLGAEPEVSKASWEVEPDDSARGSARGDAGAAVAVAVVNGIGTSLARRSVLGVAAKPTSLGLSVDGC